MTQADDLIQLAKKHITSYHLDQFGRVHLRLGKDQEPVQLRGKTIKSWLTTIYYEDKGSAPGSKAIRSAQDVLEGIALKKATQIEVEEHFGSPVDEDKAQADRLVELVLEQNPTLYLDERKEPYIFFPLDDREISYQNHRLGSSFIKSWMANLLWMDEHKAPSSETIASALNVLKAMAYRGEERVLYSRIAPYLRFGVEKTIWIDLCDERWHQILVTNKGWEVHSNDTPLFRRYRHQQPLPTPEKGGQVHDLLKYVNIDDPTQQMLYLVWIVSCFIPDISHTILSVHGAQGTGKTLLHELAKNLIDPSIMLPAALPSDQKELIQVLDHHYCVFFDNVSYLSQDISDSLCRAVTGGGFSKRKLWTDDEDIIFSFKRCLGLNGINIPAERGDLIERCLSLELSPITEEDRRGRNEILEAFDQNAGKILGAILDTVSMALAIYPEINLDGLYRMADFTKWGYVIAQALGYNPEDFLEAYGDNLNEGSIDAVAHSVVGDIVKLFMIGRKHETWEDEPMKLYEAFHEVARKNNISTNQRSYPKSATRLSRELNRLSADLMKLGYTVTRRKSNGVRLIKIESNQFEAPDPQQSFKTYTVDHDPEKKPKRPENGSLSKDLERLIKALRVIENKTGRAVDRDTLYKALKPFSYTKEHFDKLMNVVLKDGAIYEPRPGYYRVTQ